MDELLTDQQQAEVVKKWMAENGSYLIVGLVLGLGVLFGWNSWKNYQSSRAEQASVVYDSLVRSVTEARVTEAEDYLRELGTNYSGTPYLAQARFLMSRLHMDRNEFDQAADYLARIVDDGGTSAVARVARLRLARVRYHQQRYDDALEVLASGDSNSAFAARYHEVRGDVLLAQGQLDRARAEYEAALTADTQGLVDRGFVQNKLDALTNVAADAVADLSEPEPAAGE